VRGLRCGKAAGLRWCDVDLDGKAALISQQLQQYDGRLAVCPPKTAHSTRVIALDRTTVAALAEHRDRQQAEAAAWSRAFLAVDARQSGRPGEQLCLRRTFHFAGISLPPQGADGQRGD
jgi:integrase